MRVITQLATGGPEVLELGQAALPEPLPTEIRVRVAAAGVNPVDWKTRAGGGMAAVLGPPPFTVGWDVAGTVDAVGAGVTRFAVGDAVFGMPWFPRQAGGYAEFVTAPSRHFAHRPAGLSEMEAAGLSLAGLTAWQCLVDIAQRAARAAGAGARRGRRGRAPRRADRQGPRRVRDRHRLGRQAPPAARPRHRRGRSTTGRRRSSGRSSRSTWCYDLIGGEVAVRSLDVLRPDGRLICLPSAAAADAVGRAAAERGLRATGMLVEPDGDGLEELARLVDDRRLRVLVAETFPLERAAHAHRAGEMGHTTGKLVLTI